MTFWEKITGSDITRDLKRFKARIRKLPGEYRDSWEKISLYFWERSDFTGRSIIPILEGVLGLLEESAAEGLTVKEALGEDIRGFCTALAGEEGAKSYHDKWRDQLNRNVERKLGEGGKK